MLFEIFTFEIQTRLRQPSTYVFFIFLFLFSLVGVPFVFEGVEIGMVKKNAPIIIAKTMGVICGFSMLIISMIMGVPILRDFQHGITPLIYSNPVSKKDYLIGRFLGSLLFLIGIYTAVMMGMILGEYMPWIKAEEYLPFSALPYIHSFIWVALPTILFAALLFFITGALSKSLLLVYTQGLLVFVLFLLTKAIDHEWLQALLDPFGLTTLSEVNKNWTTAENNSLLIPFTGIMFWKNAFWTIIGCCIFFYGYKKFEMKVDSKTKRPKKVKRIILNPIASYPNLITHPITQKFGIKEGFIQLFQIAFFEVIYILKGILFWAIVLCATVIMIINSFNISTDFHVNSFPTSYLIIEELKEMSSYFFACILLIYSGEIVHKERETKLHLITDSTSVHNLTWMSGKLLGLFMIYGILLLLLILSGVIFQTTHAYHQYELDVYFINFFLETFPYLILYTIVAFLFQTISENKFIGIITTIAFAILSALFALVVSDHMLLNFGGKPLAPYSQMNGYGHFMIPYLWSKIHWLIFGSFLLLMMSLFKRRGVKSTFYNSLKSIRLRKEKTIVRIAAFCLCVFVAISGYIFYNTNHLNEYLTPEQKNIFRANYEKVLKSYEYIPQPKIIDVKLQIELYPVIRSYEVEGIYSMVNLHNKPIREIHLQKQIATHTKWKDIDFDRPFKLNDVHKDFHYQIYNLEPPLLPGDSLQFKFTQYSKPLGFENNDYNTDIVFNGSFFDNDLFPSIGYEGSYELNDTKIRVQHNLQAKTNKAPIDDTRELTNARTGCDSKGIDLEIIVGTDQSQTVVTSGNLMNQWTSNERNYYHYKTDQKIINFYALVSAEYERMHKKFELTTVPSHHPIDLEIYYHKGHEHNLDRMMESMKYSLNYYSQHFSPYPYQHLRIMEIPSYYEFAQSFPGAVPFSESVGFMMDIDDEEDVDMVFFNTAHEIAHQWWGIQLEAANVQGKNFIIETLAQYAALMVFKKRYGEDKLDQFLNLQHDDYSIGTKRQKHAEPSLSLVEDEAHIYYAKGAINMYALQSAIGEERLNQGLRNFLDQWRSSNDPERYATSNDLISAFRKASPANAQLLISQLFEEVHTIELDSLNGSY